MVRHLKVDPNQNHLDERNVVFISPRVVVLVSMSAGHIAVLLETAILAESVLAGNDAKVRSRNSVVPISES